MDTAQQERFSKSGAISHEDMLDKQIGVVGSKERIAYEQELAEELAKANNKQNKVFYTRRSNPTNTE